MQEKRERLKMKHVYESVADQSTTDQRVMRHSTQPSEDVFKDIDSYDLPLHNNDSADLSQDTRTAGLPQQTTGDAVLARFFEPILFDTNPVEKKASFRRRPIKQSQSTATKRSLPLQDQSNELAPKRSSEDYMNLKSCRENSLDVNSTSDLKESAVKQMTGREYADVACSIPFEARSDAVPVQISNASPDRSLNSSSSSLDRNSRRQCDEGKYYYQQSIGVHKSSDEIALNERSDKKITDNKPSVYDTRTTSDDFDSFLEDLDALAADVDMSTVDTAVPMDEDFVQEMNELLS